MEIISGPIEGLKLIIPRVFGDERGYFFESFQAQKLREAGIDAVFIQDNESKSLKGVLRGLHFQLPPYAQGKLVRVIRGAVLDVAVDLRKDSPTYGKFASFRLSDANKHQLWIPEGFAHGFLALDDDTIFTYKCTNYYHPGSEGSIRYDDPDLNINWEYTDPLVSAKDLAAPAFRDFNSPFTLNT